MRDSTIFYRSFYESIQELPLDSQAKIYNAIFNYSLNGQSSELSGIESAIFTLIKPQLDANNKRYENGKKPKTKPKESETEAKPKQDLSETEANKNVNVNENKNKNKKENNIELVFPFSSQAFIDVWDKLKSQPKWKKKTNDALQASLDFLKPYNETEAIQIMNNSIAGNWQGVFELKTRIPEAKPPEQKTVDFMRYDNYPEYVKKCNEVNFTPIPESQFWTKPY